MFAVGTDNHKLNRVLMFAVGTGDRELNRVLMFAVVGTDDREQIRF